MPNADRPFDLRCEFLENPLAIEAKRPRLSWKVPLCEQGTRQLAIQIQVADSCENLYNSQLLWDSGEVQSSQSVDVPYGGPELASLQSAAWRVRIRLEAGWTPWSVPAHWEVGILDPSLWMAKWVGVDSSGAEASEVHVVSSGPFQLEGRVRRARLHYSARGLIRPVFNGEFLSDGFDPGWTDYAHRIPYCVLDLTKKVRQGSNVLAAWIADGWYCGNICWFGRNRYGDSPWGLLRLSIEFEDRDPLFICSGETWHGWQSEILQSDLMAGETWKLGLAEDSNRVQVRCESLGSVPLVGQAWNPVREIEALQPLSIEPKGAGRFIVDFGQNHCGVVRLDLEGGSAKRLVIRHAEVLDSQGELYTQNLRSARATDEVAFIEGREGWSPMFTLHGYRYAEVSGYEEGFAPKNVVSRVIHSELERTGWFECGHPGLNRLAENTVWSLKSNFVDVPTDCPQRDERLGWLGDAQVFAPTAAFLYDVAAFFAKWMPDVIFGASPDGVFPNVAPQLAELKEGAPGWADAGVIVPWVMYEFYADRHLLGECFPAMRKYISAVLAENADFVWRNRRSHDFGDWLSIGEETDKTLIATAYLGKSARIVADAARALDREADFGEAMHIYESVSRAFKREYPLESISTQTGLVLAVEAFEYSADEWIAIGDQLEESIACRGGKLATGFLGVGGLLETLANAGRDRLAIDLLLSKEFPSWLFPIENGATTIWERWDGWTPDNGFQDPGMNSFNHYCFGSVVQFLFERIGGIKCLSPGFRTIGLLPMIDPRIGHADVRYRSRYGHVRSAWSIDQGEVEWTIEIPPNTTAGAKLPRCATDHQSWRTIGPLHALEGTDGRAFRLEPGICRLRGPFSFSVR